VTSIVYGIDASSFQGTIVWALVDAGCAFGFEKVTEGTGYTNPAWKAAKPAMAARKVATGFTPGAYMFLDEAPGAAQADHFADVAGNLDGWAIAIDVERSGTSSPTLDQAKAAVNRLRAHYPRRPIIGYIPHWYWGGQDTTFVDVLWASQYVTGPGHPADLYAKVPAAWWASYGGRAVSLLQFTSSATVPGVQGAVDCSAFRGDQAALRAVLLPKPAAPPPPPPAAPPAVAQMYGYLVTEAGVGNAHALTGRAVTSHDGGKSWS